jgi:phosphoserine aminotransferase
MTKRIYNFSAGPATLPTEVLERAQAELLSIENTGVSVMEISHRSPLFEEINQQTQEKIKSLLALPKNYQVLFLQGGATLQFSLIPMNFLPKNGAADLVVTGTWSKKAAKETARFGAANIIFSSEAENFRTIPAQNELRFNEFAAFIHYTSNETIDGVEFKYDLDGGQIPVFCDASSNILSKPIDVEKYALIYAGAQKNLGPSGVTIVIVREDLFERIPPNLSPMFNYRSYSENKSLLNTPNTWGIYLVGLVCDWLKAKGGAAVMQTRNVEKARILYAAIDQSGGFYRGHAERDARSTMNATFRLPSEELEEKFCAEAESAGMSGLKGHRSVGGIRASLYNAMTREGVETLVDFMKEFARTNG